MSILWWKEKTSYPHTIRQIFSNTGTTKGINKHTKTSLPAQIIYLISWWCFWQVQPPIIENKFGFWANSGMTQKYLKYPRGICGFVNCLKHCSKEDINSSSWRIFHFDFARNTYKMKNNDVNGQTLWLSPNEITAFPDFDNLTPIVKPGFVPVSSKLPANKLEIAFLTSQTEVKFYSLQIAMREIHKI